MQQASKIFASRKKRKEEEKKQPVEKKVTD